MGAFLFSICFVFCPRKNVIDFINKFYTVHKASQQLDIKKTMKKTIKLFIYLF